MRFQTCFRLLVPSEAIEDFNNIPSLFAYLQKNVKEIFQDKVENLSQQATTSTNNSADIITGPCNPPPDPLPAIICDISLGNDLQSLNHLNKILEALNPLKQGSITFTVNGQKIPINYSPLKITKEFFQAYRRYYNQNMRSSGDDMSTQSESHIKGSLFSNNESTYLNQRSIRLFKVNEASLKEEYNMAKLLVDNYSNNLFEKVKKSTLKNSNIDLDKTSIPQLFKKRNNPKKMAKGKTSNLDSIPDKQVIAFKSSNTIDKSNFGGLSPQNEKKNIQESSIIQKIQQSNNFPNSALQHTLNHHRKQSSDQLATLEKRLTPVGGFECEVYQNQDLKEPSPIKKIKIAGDKIIRRSNYPEMAQAVGMQNHAFRVNPTKFDIPSQMKQNIQSNNLENIIKGGLSQMSGGNLPPRQIPGLPNPYMMQGMPFMNPGMNMMQMNPGFMRMQSMMMNPMIGVMDPSKQQKYMMMMAEYQNKLMMEMLAEQKKESQGQVQGQEQVGRENVFRGMGNDFKK